MNGLPEIGRFEIRPAWAPSLDRSPCLAGTLLVPKVLHRFERTPFYATKFETCPRWGAIPKCIDPLLSVSSRQRAAIAADVLGGLPSQITQTAKASRNVPLNRALTR